MILIYISLILSFNRKCLNNLPCPRHSANCSSFKDEWNLLFTLQALTALLEDTNYDHQSDKCYHGTDRLLWGRGGQAVSFAWGGQRGQGGPLEGIWAVAELWRCAWGTCISLRVN